MCPQVLQFRPENVPFDAPAWPDIERKMLGAIVIAFAFVKESADLPWTQGAWRGSAQGIGGEQSSQPLRIM